MGSTWRDGVPKRTREAVPPKLFMVTIKCVLGVELYDVCVRSTSFSTASSMGIRLFRAEEHRLIAERMHEVVVKMIGE